MPKKQEDPDWFNKPVYKDVLDYIHSVNCHYKFNELPLAWLGLPTKKSNKHIRPKIRQQLQILRDKGILSTTRRGV
ncbi:MAG: hypothetical protein OHK0032_11690 [Thermodesulfovibrionales bacterium]